MNPNDIEALSREANQNLDAERLEEAVQMFDRALAADATRVNDWINRDWRSGACTVMKRRWFPTIGPLRLILGRHLLG